MEIPPISVGLSSINVSIGTPQIGNPAVTPKPVMPDATPANPQSVSPDAPPVTTILKEARANMLDVLNDMKLPPTQQNLQAAQSLVTYQQPVNPQTIQLVRRAMVGIPDQSPATSDAVVVLLANRLPATPENVAAVRQLLTGQPLPEQVKELEKAVARLQQQMAQVVPQAVQQTVGQVVVRQTIQETPEPESPEEGSDQDGKPLPAKGQGGGGQAAQTAAGGLRLQLRSFSLPGTPPPEVPNLPTPDGQTAETPAPAAKQPSGQSAAAQPNPSASQAGPPAQSSQPATLPPAQPSQPTAPPSAPSGQAAAPAPAPSGQPAAPSPAVAPSVPPTLGMAVTAFPTPVSGDLLAPVEGMLVEVLAEEGDPVVPLLPPKSAAGQARPAGVPSGGQPVASAGLSGANPEGTPVTPGVSLEDAPEAGPLQTPTAAPQPAGAPAKLQPQPSPSPAPQSPVPQSSTQQMASVPQAAATPQPFAPAVVAPGAPLAVSPPAAPPPAAPLSAPPAAPLPASPAAPLPASPAAPLPASPAAPLPASPAAPLPASPAAPLPASPAAPLPASPAAPLPASSVAPASPAVPMTPVASVVSSVPQPQGGLVVSPPAASAPPVPAVPLAPPSPAPAAPSSIALPSPLPVASGPVTALQPPVAQEPDVPLPVPQPSGPPARAAAPAQAAPPSPGQVPTDPAGIRLPASAGVRLQAETPLPQAPERPVAEGGSPSRPMPSTVQAPPSGAPLPPVQPGVPSPPIAERLLQVRALLSAVSQAQTVKDPASLSKQVPVMEGLLGVLEEELVLLQQDLRQTLGHMPKPGVMPGKETVEQLFKLIFGMKAEPAAQSVAGQQMEQLVRQVVQIKEQLQQVSKQTTQLQQHLSGRELMAQPTFCLPLQIGAPAVALAGEMMVYPDQERTNNEQRGPLQLVLGVETHHLGKVTIDLTTHQRELVVALKTTDPAVKAAVEAKLAALNERLAQLPYDIKGLSCQVVPFDPPTTLLLPQRSNTWSLRRIEGIV